MYNSFADPVDPIAAHQLQSAFHVIKQLSELAERYQKLAPAERSAAAIEGLRHDADENDVILSAYIMQADPQAYDQVRAAYADQQSFLQTNEKNRMNYNVAGPAQNTRPAQAAASAKRVADESAFAEKTVGRIQQLQQNFNLQPQKITNSPS